MQLIYIILDRNFCGDTPKVVSFEEAERFYKEKCADSPSAQKYGLGDVNYPCVFTDEEFKDFLWIAKAN